MTETISDIIRASRFGYAEALPANVDITDLAAVEDRLLNSEIMVNEKLRERQFARDGEPRVIKVGGQMIEFSKASRQDQHRLITREILALSHQRASQDQHQHEADARARAARTCSQCGQETTIDDLAEFHLRGNVWHRVCSDCRVVAHALYLDQLPSDHPSRRAARAMIKRL